MVEAVPPVPLQSDLSAGPSAARVGGALEPPPPARLARLFSQELVREAQAVFGSRLCREVSESEARAMLANLTGFIRLLTASGQRDPHGEAPPSESLCVNSG